MLSRVALLAGARSAGCAVLAVLAALVASFVAFFLLNAIPFWLLMLLGGGEGMEAAPAHGGAILFLTLPLSAIVAVGSCPVLAISFYRKTLRWRAPSAE